MLQFKLPGLMLTADLRVPHQTAGCHPCSNPPTDFHPHNKVALIIRMLNKFQPHLTYFILFFLTLSKSLFLI